MSQNLSKILSLFLSFCLILEQSVFAQAINLADYLTVGTAQCAVPTDKFRPLHLRYISYDNQANDFKILLDKGDFFNQKTEKPKNEKTSESLNSQTPKLSNSETPELEKATQELMKYFFIGLSLPNEKFWVNLRPDSPDNILDSDLEKTDIGRIFLEADLQLKKDTSSMTSPQTKEGREYWDKLYKKAGELFGTENITIPTLTRPWIVPGEIILGESSDGAYVYKATLKVMLEEDYLKSSQLSAVSSQQYTLNDPRLKELNEYSTRLIRETIIPKLTYAVNTAKRYAPLRQVYYSLILAQWFKQKYGSSGSTRAPGISAPVNSYIDLVDSGNLANLASSQPYDKQVYFRQYQKSFRDGEYNLQEPVYTATEQIIRRYISGGLRLSSSPTTTIKTPTININKPYLISSSPMTDNLINDYLKEKWVKDYPANLQKMLRKMRKSKLSLINSDGTLTIKIVPRNDSSKNILKFRVFPQGQIRHFAYKYNRAEKILYLRNLETDKDIGIGLENPSGNKHWLYIDRPHPEKNSFILSDNVYTFNGTELTNEITGAAYPMSEGIIDLTKITKDSGGIKNLLRLSTSSAMERRDKDIVKDAAEKLYQAILLLHEELKNADPEGRNIILEGWSFKIKDAIVEAAGLSPEEKESLGKAIHDAIPLAHKKELTDVSIIYDIVKIADGKIKNSKDFGKDERETTQKIFNKVYALTSSSPAVQNAPDKLQEAQLSVTEANNGKGGIDFTRPEIISRPVSELQSLSGSPLTVNTNLDFEAEWRGIQAVFNAGVRPSARRLADFAASAAASPVNIRRIEDVRGLTADILRRDEEKENVDPAEPELKKLLSYSY